MTSAPTRVLASMLVSVLALGLITVVPVRAEKTDDGVRVRKAVQDLSSQERRDFVEAILALKVTPSPYDSALSYYDQFVAWHVELSRCSPANPLRQDMQMSHGGPMFLPWHRQFVLLFEDALRQVSGKPIAVPYWDWTDSASTRAVFSDELMGGDGDPNEQYAVTTGPFRKDEWRLNVNPIGVQWAPSASPYLTRRIGSWPGSPLPSGTDVRDALSAARYDVAPFSTESDPAHSFRNALEGFRPPLAAAAICGPDGVMIVVTPGKPSELHNAVHLWVGGLLEPGGAPRMIGTMANVTSSPNDPVFFLHHSMIDRIWAQWQEVNGTDTYRPRSGHPQHNADTAMYPYDRAGIRVTPEDVADIEQLGYRYQPATSRGDSSGTPSRQSALATIAPPVPATATTYVCQLGYAA